jgi:hypothetical protein
LGGVCEFRVVVHVGLGAYRDETDRLSLKETTLPNDFSGSEDILDSRGRRGVLRLSGDVGRPGSGDRY